MRKPNFFIIGAPKCGTTSWAAWLAEHPQIYFSLWKEPNFFNTDMEFSLRPGAKRYEGLFRRATPTHRVVGEGSAAYFFSRVAVRNIEIYTRSQAKYLVCLRNPVDMAASLHGQWCYDNVEQIRDFGAAWYSSVSRRGKSPQTNDEESLINYGNVCLLGAQLEALYAVVPPERVCVTLLDDAHADIRTQYRSVLAFLGVDDDGRMYFPAENVAKQVRWPFRATLPRVLADVKFRLGFTGPIGTYAGRLVNRMISRSRPRQSISHELRVELQDYFREDILLLAKLLGRDLSHWLAPPSASQV